MKDRVTDPFDEIVTRHDSLQRAGDCDVIGGVLLQAHTDRAQLIRTVQMLRRQLRTLQGVLEAVRVAAWDNQMDNADVIHFITWKSFDPGWIRYDLIEKAVLLGTSERTPELEES